MWRPELAGKRVKCKCGNVMTVAAAPPGNEPEDLYDLAPDPEPVKPKATRAAKAPLAPRASLAPSGSGGAAAAELRPQSALRPAAAGAAGPLGYQSGAARRDRAGLDVTMDINRDVYVPVGLLIVGLAMYVAYYAITMELSGSGIAITAVGLSLMTAVKAAVMFGFAVTIAGPLGVSFGGLFTAALKLAAIAVFSDGTMVWLDAGMDHFLQTGAWGFCIIFPIQLGIYWVLLIYLFSMDPGDSWMVVILLAVFDFILRWLLVIVLLAWVMGLGGVSAGSLNIPSISSAAGADPLVVQVKENLSSGHLIEARKFIEGGRQSAVLPWANNWYEAGCTNVWFQVSWDINHRYSAEQLILEMPTDPQKRAKVIDLIKDYYKAMSMDVDEDLVEDTSGKYIEVDLRT